MHIKSRNVNVNVSFKKMHAIYHLKHIYLPVPRYTLEVIPILLSQSNARFPRNYYY